ncbi:putative ribonuclease H-like domain-containing protein [Tanacetum coccineum]
MVGKSVLNNKGRVTGQREVRPVWNNAQRVNHQNKLTHPYPKRNFVPNSSLQQSLETRLSLMFAKQSSPSAATSISTARHINTDASKPRVNDASPIKYSYFKAHLPLRRPFNKKSAGNPQYALQDQGIFDSGCSRHMTGNKSYLTDYQDIDGGFVAFAGSPKGGIKREFSVARTPQQNRVAERKNKSLIEAARTMLADSLLPTIFWAEAVNTSCYVQNRVQVTKPHNKTPYELLLGRPPSISFMRPFGCPVTILNTLDPLGKFDGKANEGFLVGYSINSKAFRVFNTRTRKSVTAGNQTNGDTGIEKNVNAGQARQEKASDHEYILLPLMLSNSSLSSSSQSIDNKDANEVPGKGDDDLSESNDQERIDSSTNDVNTTRLSINTASENINTGSPNINIASPIPNDSSMQSLENTGIFDDAYDDREVGADADLNNLGTTMNVSPIPTTRIHKDHPKDQIIGDITSATQTRRMTKISKEHAMVCYIKKQRSKNHKDYQNCLFACFLKQIEPKKVIQALTDPSWIEAMQEELLQFKLQKVWTLVNLLKGKRAIGTKWVYRNKKDERGIVVRNKARLVAQEKALYGLHQALRAWYETLSTYLLENRYRRGTIDKTLFIKKDKSDILLVQVYVDDIIFGSTKKSLCVEFEQMMHKRFQMSSIGELTFFLGLQVQQKEDRIFISQDKYVADILKKFDFVTVKTASTPMESNKALVKDEEVEVVDVHLYRSMIGSLMYLTASRPDITFVVCACARFQITPKISHLHAVKRIFRYLKGQPKLGLWYPMDSPFNLEAFSNSDYAGASLDRKSITRGCQFLGKRDSYEEEVDSSNRRFSQTLMLQFFSPKVFDVSRFLTFDASIEITNLNSIDMRGGESSGPIHLVADETVHKELGDRMERAATTASSLEAEQDNGNIKRTQSMATLNEPSP